MLHLPALPGSPRSRLSLPAIVEHALRDADTLVAGGVHGLMLENFFDTPFFPGRVPPAVIAAMTEIAGHVRRRLDVPLGINVLRNDGCGALAVAGAVGAAFIRVNILCGARVTDQGVIQGIAHELLRDRAALHADAIRIFADVDVKHSAPLGPPRPLEEEVADTIERGGADAIIVSGGGTGRPTDVAQVRAARAAAGTTPVLVGSGVTAETIGQFLPHADGFIVGTAFKVDGVAEKPVEAARVRALLERVR
jgi:membrane complex biogenesis BtpA family protein